MENKGRDEMTVRVVRELKELDEQDIQRLIDFLAGMKVCRDLENQCQACK